MQKQPNESKHPRMTGAQIAIRCLELQGVELLFAYPGGAALELHQALLNSPIRVVLPRHEQGGAFGAAGYARSTGRIGVCMATSGPGATNLLTGIADAYADSIPLVIVTGQVPRRYIGKNAFQETDIIGMTRPVVKHSYLVMDIEEIPQIFAEAFYLAGSGRPGPVHIDIPKDIQQASCSPHFPETSEKMVTYRPKMEPDDKDVEAILHAIRRSERPCLYVGGGIIHANAHQELQEFAEKFNIPVATTLMGIGAIPEDHPLSLKWLGMHGTYAANFAANESDLLLAFGVRFDDRVTGNVAGFAEHATIVHVDIDPAEINKNKRAHISAISDIRHMLQRLNSQPIHKEYEAWHRQINDWKAKYPLRYRKTTGAILTQHAVHVLYQKSKGNAIVVTGVGQHQMWAAQFYNFKRPRQLLTSGGLGTMGFGLPAAIGAKLALPKETVVLIDGDGSFQMNIQELGTAFSEGVAVKMMICNNQHLGMVAQWEDRFYGGRRGNTVLSVPGHDASYPNFVQIAKGYSIPGRDVWTNEELPGAIEEMLKADGPYLLDIHCEYQDHVLPMIPAGGYYKDIMVE
jgi:acetolactate synthase-1/2/3 large subunit